MPLLLEKVRLTFRSLLLRTNINMRAAIIRGTQRAQRSATASAAAAAAGRIAVPGLCSTAVAVSSAKSSAILVRHIHATPSRHSDASSSSSAPRPALSTFSAEEDELRSMVSSFARSTIGPRVAKMDEEGVLDPMLLQQLFNQGLMGQ